MVFISFTLNNVSLNKGNIYRTETFDKYHAQKWDVSFYNVQLVDLNDKDNIIEKPDYWSRNSIL